MHHLMLHYMIRELFAFAGGLFALPALIMHVCSTPGAPLRAKVLLYILDAIAIGLILISVVY